VKQRPGIRPAVEGIGIQYILMLMAFVVFLDLALATFFFDLSWQISALSLFVFALAFFLLGFKRKKASADSGWRLGSAEELTNPNHPVRVKHALIPKKTLNLGLIGIGAQGSGKTESVILGQLKAVKGYSPESGFALFDGKGDIDTYQKFVAMGERPDFFFSSELPGSDSINLLSGTAYDVLERLTTLLIGETTSTSFYADDQRAVLSRILPVLLNLKIPVNLRDLYVVLTLPEAGRELLRIARHLKLNAPDLQFAETPGLISPPKSALKTSPGF